MSATQYINAQRGFSMVEVLVTVIVLAIGLLGLAGLQAYGLQNNHGAYIRSQASLLSYDIVDSMRANRNGALNGNYNVDFGDTLAGAGQAVLDVNRWVQELADTLPNGEGSIQVDASGAATISVRWDEDRIREQEDNLAPGDADPTVIVTRTRI
jgi:type IV pilus assembly protein PilV